MKWFKCLFNSAYPLPPKYEEPMKVKCIKEGVDLTVGKVYDIIDSNDLYYIIVDDAEEKFPRFKTLFEPVKEKTMTKQEALEKIEELKRFIEQEDKPKITQYPTKEDNEGRINGEWVMSFDDFDCGNLFLPDRYGYWTNEDGRKISGYLKWHPK